MKANSPSTVTSSPPTWTLLRLTNPVWLMHTTGHYGVANHQALELAHINAASKDPKAGTIDRDAQGIPTGVLKEAAMEAVASLIPPPTPEQRRLGILRMVDTLHREGMTAVKDPDIYQPTWDAYRQLQEEGKLTAHICVLWHGGTTLASAREVISHIQSLPPGDGNLHSCGVKLYMDGSGGGRTAWLYKDWDKNLTGVDRGNQGYPAIDPPTYRQMVRLIHQAGIPVGTHAIGDRAIDWVVDTYAQVLQEKPTPGLRHAIIHANIPTNHAIATMAELQKKYDAGYPESQPPFIWWIGDTYAGNFGPERDLRLNPFHTYLAKGIIWGGAPTTPSPRSPRATASGPRWSGRPRRASTANVPSVPRSRWTFTPRSAPTLPGPRGSSFSKIRWARSNPASKPTSPSGIKTCTPFPAKSCKT